MLNDEAMSNYYYYLGDNFKALPLLLSFIIMVLLSIGWLILLFRNNAFKRFYPVSRWQLFGRFVVYLVIIFGMTSTYVSFIAGEKAKVHWRYSDSYIHSVLQQYPENFDSPYKEVRYSNENQIKEFFIARNAKNVKTNTFIEIVKQVPYLNERDMNFVSKAFQIDLNDLQCYKNRQYREQLLNS